MKGHGQFCPVALAMDLLGERWTVLVVREVMAGSEHFSEIHRGLPRVSKSVLSQRLRTLVDAGVLEKKKAPGNRTIYALTVAGEELRPIIMACGAWGKRWVRPPNRPDEIDLDLLMWDVRRRLDREAFPDEQVVVEFAFSRPRATKARYWLVVPPQPGEVDLCITRPAFDVDVTLESDPNTLHDVWLGDLDLDAALRVGRVKAEGPRKLVRGVPNWFLRGEFAPVPRRV